jgi:hypothetical protein
MNRHKLLLIGLLVFGLSGCTTMSMNNFRPKPRQQAKCKCHGKKCRHQNRHTACCCQTGVCMDEIAPLYPGDMYGGGMMAPTVMGYPMMMPMSGGCGECGSGMCGGDGAMGMPMSGMTYTQMPVSGMMMPDSSSGGCACGQNHSPMSAPHMSPSEMSPSQMHAPQILAPPMQFSAPSSTPQQLAPVAPMEAPKPVPPENNLPPVPSDANPPGAPPTETPVDPVGWNSLSFPPMSSQSGGQKRPVASHQTRAVPASYQR